jgi:oligoendopeptidase F
MTVLKERNEIDSTDKWNLEKLFKDDAAWQRAYASFSGAMKAITEFKGRIGESVQILKSVLDTQMKLETELERLAYYAMLRLQENLGDNAAMNNYIKIQSLSAEYAALSSFLSPEIQAVAADVMERYLSDPLLREYRIYLSRLLRYKAHILSEREEALLAPLGELFDTADSAFSALADADMNFGEIETDAGKKPLTQAGYVSFLKSPSRITRKNAYERYYSIYDGHKNTIAALYGGSVRQDIYKARVRGFKSAREASLFADNVDAEVYDNLIATIHEGLPVLHRYYALRKKILKLDELRHYDVYVPLAEECSRKPIGYEEGVELIAEALKPLGSEYVNTMKRGLLGGWVDRYENKGKSSGAFSAGSYSGEPYILMNYKEEDIRSLFTLAHEAGHSMHSHYSVANNPFQHYNYSIFEAEVASTFNEALLFDYLLRESNDEKLKQRLIGERLDDILSTLFRQTMFAEYEHLVHKHAENGEAAALDLFRTVYQGLLTQYFGPEMVFEPVSNLECLRIPHFYRAFYVYKYATGISASLALSRRVLTGGDRERDAYLAFLKSGGSRFPIESLKLAGVDMADKGPVKDAVAVFSGLLDKFETYF